MPKPIYLTEYYTTYTGRVTVTWYHRKIVTTPTDIKQTYYRLFVTLICIRPDSDWKQRIFGCISKP